MICHPKVRAPTWRTWSKDLSHLFSLPSSPPSLTNMSNSFPSLDSTPRAFPLTTISEDTLDYTIHLPPNSAEVESFATLITSYVESLLTRPWLWNKDGWELKVSRHTALSSPSRSEGNRGTLVGRMRVSDSVDDEWLVVWLLWEISKRWTELVIR